MLLQRTYSRAFCNDLCAVHAEYCEGTEYQKASKLRCLQICMLLWRVSVLWTVRRALLSRVVPLLRGAAPSQHLDNHYLARQPHCHSMSTKEVCPVRMQATLQDIVLPG